MKKLRKENKKGFLSFALVLAMILCLLYMALALQETNFEFEKTKNELIKAEQANKERTLLENGTDRIITAKLEEQIMLENFNVQKAKNEINSKLAQYLKGKTITTNLFRQKTGEISTNFLNENTTAQILKGKNLAYAEWTYSSNTAKNSIISAKFGNKIISYFEIPIGHTQKIIKPI